MKSLETGYAELDRLTGGLKAGEIFLLSGGHAAGKTSLALNIVRNIVRQEKAVLYFSLQESGELISQRLLSLESGVPLDAIRDRSASGAEVRNLTGAVMECKQWNMLVDDSPELAISELIRKAGRIQEYLESGKAENPVAIMMDRPRLPKGEKLDLIVVDHLQLMKAGENGLPGVIRDLKGLAEDLEIPVLVLAIEDKTAPAREAAADTYVYLCRDGETAWLAVLKSKSGEEGHLELHIELKTMDFSPRMNAGKQ